MIDEVRWLDYAILNIERGWTQNALARSGSPLYGDSVDPDSWQARSWCLLGALHHAYRQITGKPFDRMPDEDRAVFRLIARTLHSNTSFGSIEGWNDAIAKDKGYVLAMMRKVRQQLALTRLANERNERIAAGTRRASVTRWDRFWDRIDRPALVIDPPTTFATAHDKELVA